ncbi:hypothetical protein HRbin16_01980 [bacterium HR16]|nr:hypothetical protein HRbin16_01980 [bacterium HR16]
MTPREVIRRNLERDNPPRIGMDFDGGRMNDFCFAGFSPSETWQQKRWVEGEVEYFTDEWGNIWYRSVYGGQRGEVFQPALDDWAKLKDYQLPDMDNPKRYEGVRRRFAQETERYRVGYLPGFPFAICRYLRKMENYFADLVLEREHIDELHERVTALLERIIALYAQAGADAVMFAEDWGVQDRLLIHPSMWREVFKPLFVRLCHTAKAHGVKVIMHSCGYVWDILDDVAEAGICCMQFDQPALYGLERLAAKLRELNLCLYSPVDIQRVLPTGNRELIEREAHRMVELFGGGFIAKNYPDLKGIGIQPEWDEWAYQVFLSHARSSGVV